MNTVTEYIEKRRKAKGIKQETLAELMGIKQPQYSKFINDEKIDWLLVGKALEAMNEVEALFGSPAQYVNHDDGHLKSLIDEIKFMGKQLTRSQKQNDKKDKAIANKDKLLEEKSIQLEALHELLNKRDIKKKKSFTLKNIAGKQELEM